MCRLFGLHAGPTPVSATFWLLDAPDSLAAQSRRNPDGAGIGVFGPDGTAKIDKQPIAAWDDLDFATAARELTATTFVAHVRHASTGANTVENTHPFTQDGRIFAHNGVVQGLDQLEARLAELGVSDLVQGETDSERVFALITAEIRRQDGAVTLGLTAAIAWISEHLPLYSINLLLSTPTDLWAVRYPASNELWILQRPAGGTDTAQGTGDAQGLDARTSRIHARSDQLAAQASVIFASERMDDDPGWRLLDSGDLVHVAADLTIQTSRPFPARPSHLMSQADLDPVTAASQRPT